MGGLGQPGENVTTLLSTAPAPAAQAGAAAPTPPATPAAAQAPAAAPERAPGERVKISPVAKKLAQDHGSGARPRRGHRVMAS
jgi:pyruvate/2-oxoglutarate dehydrogenase complex dihydrolipoamide acyltransferase (E2) component